MGIRRLFSRVGQNFPGGQNILFAQKHLKDTIFLKKVQKTYYFGCPGRRKGQGPPLAL